MMTGIVTATTTAKRKARRNELWGMLRAGSWRVVVGWSVVRSGGRHATGLEGTSSAQYSEIHTSGEQKTPPPTTPTPTPAVQQYQIISNNSNNNTASTINNTHE